MHEVAGVASRALADLLLGPVRHGTVIGVLPSAVHATVGTDVVALVTGDAVQVPNAVALAALRAERPFASIRAGHPLRVGDGRLAVGPVEVTIVRWFDPRPALPEVAASDLAEHTRHLAALLPPLEASIAAAVADLRTAAEDLAAPAARRAVERLVGRGSGLTPAGDDVVAGALGASVLLRAPAAFAAALDLPAPRTTTFSASLLRHAARGEVPPQVAQLLAALCGRGEIEPAARTLVAVGHTSGAALAVGAAIGATAAARQRGTSSRSLWEVAS